MFKSCTCTNFLFSFLFMHTPLLLSIYRILCEYSYYIFSNNKMMTNKKTLMVNVLFFKNKINNTCNYYHRFRWYATLENKTPAERFPKFPSVLRVIDRSDQNPPITATSLISVTFWPSLRHASGLWIGGFPSDMSITRKIGANFENVSAGVLFSKVVY